MRYLHTLDSRAVDELVRSYNEVDDTDCTTTYEVGLLPAVIVVDRPKAIMNSHTIGVMITDRI